MAGSTAVLCPQRVLLVKLVTEVSKNKPSSGLCIVRKQTGDGPAQSNSKLNLDEPSHVLRHLIQGVTASWPTVHTAGLGSGFGNGLDPDVEAEGPDTRM